MSTIDKIKPTSQSIEKTEQFYPQTQSKSPLKSDSPVVTETRPDIENIKKAEALGQSLASKIDSTALEAQTTQLNEERIRALLNDDE